ncbi:iron chaperone [Jeotgalibacillus salarius]|uniref:Iron chaperone n=1 Tax=Jeotgalibacillus salarius TaxID=546023 RepID=A0A4Y8LNN1_9BACL|nr:iron chaperone [Jeotgalibacillus salarius]TFE02373.1 iron chaperone [Jeotgalibacillus salarius]
METFQEFLETIENSEHRKQTADVLGWVSHTYPELIQKIAWNQPMFTHHGTFIIAFSTSKKHLAVSPEKAGIDYFADEIKKAGHDHSKMLVRFPWNQPVDYDLLRKMIDFNMKNKAECTTFWRK